jgi:PKD repeat protein
MAGDNSLGDNGSAGGNQVWSDLNELEKGFQGVTGVNILVLADEADVGDTRCYRVQYDNTPDLASPLIPLTDINATWLDELDMGSPQTLIDFATWAVNTYPADRFYLELWDHGSGCFRRRGEEAEENTRYICQDSHGTRLEMDDIRLALVELNLNTGAIFDIFTMDACLMGMVEVYYQLYPYARIAVGSQEEDPWDGLDYTFVELFKTDPSIAPETLATSVVQYFYDSYTDGQPNPTDETFITMAAVNLTKMYNAISTTFDPFAEEMIKRSHYYSHTGTNEYMTDRSKTEEFRTTSYVDLMHFLEKIIQGKYGPILKPKAQDLWNGLNDSVILSKTYTQNPNANGLSIYFPIYETFYSNGYNGATSYLLFPQDTLWDEFLKEFYNPTKKCNITFKLNALDGDELFDDVEVTFKQNDKTPISGAKIYLDGVLQGVTDGNGQFSKKDLGAGTHRFELISNDLVGVVDVYVKNKAPQAGFTLSSPTANEDQVIILNGSLSLDPEDDPLVYFWDFDISDGLEFTDALGMEVNHSYKYKGTYTVSLMVNDSHSHTIAQEEITVNNVPPVADAGQSSMVVNEDELITFDGSGSTDTTSDLLFLEYMWVYGDGDSNNWTSDPTVSHAYYEKGEYTATLYVRDDDKAISQVEVAVVVNNVAPESHFRITNSVYNDTSKDVDLLENTVYVFDGSICEDTPSDRPSLLREWNFSLMDNRSVYRTYLGVKTQHMFQYKGNWEVSLKVRDNNGAFDVVSLKLQVANRPPKAIATLNGTIMGYEDEVILFDAANSSDSLEDLPGLKYLWDFDDDDVYEESGINVLHSFPRSGYYSANLKVYDMSNSSDVDSFTVWILNRAPEVTLEDNYTMFEDEVLLLDVEDVKDSAEDILMMKMAWDLDNDGFFENRSLEIRLSFPRFGIYNISVKVTDPEGLGDSKTVAIEVLNLRPTAVITNDPCENNYKMQFYGNASKDSPSDMSTLLYFWDFGDGKSSYGVNPEHDFGGPGTYNVTLTITDDDGAIDTTYIIVMIKEEDETSYWLYFVIIVIILLTLVGIYLLNRWDRSKNQRGIEQAREALEEERQPRRRKKVLGEELEGSSREREKERKKGKVRGRRKHERDGSEEPAQAEEEEEPEDG